MRGKITISKDSDDIVTISIEDSASGINIVKVGMGLKDYAEAITGLARVDCEIIRKPTKRMVEYLGKKKEVESFPVDKVDSFCKEDQIRKVNEEFGKSGLAKEGWEISNDGTRSQQNGNRHWATICRYIGEPE